MLGFIRFIFCFSIIVTVFIGIPLWIFFTLLDYNRSYPIIDFKSFKKFQALNPFRWNCHDNHVECKLDGHYYSYEKFSFGVLDFFKYKLWLKVKAKNERNEKHNKSKQRMMDAVKKDIAASEAEAKRMQAEALKILKQRHSSITDGDILDIMKLVEEYKEKIWDV